MKKVLLFAATLITGGLFAQTDIADARTYGLGQTITVSGVATNGSELGSIRYMQDGTAGIAGYGGPITGVSRYDSITITGPLIEFSGLLEISTVTNVVNHGPAVITPTPLQVPITSVDETIESELIEIQNVTFVETGNFSIGGSGATYTITDGSNTLDVRLNATSNFNGQPIPTGPVTVTGLTGQFNANYQIVPRDMNDIVAYVAPALEINVKLEGVDVLTGSDYFIGNTSSINVTIENYGSNTLTITGATFTGPDAADFSSDIVAGTIAPLSSQSYTINYAPTGIGSHFATIEIGSDDADENPYIINFEGVGTDNLANEPSANPSGLTFPLLEPYTLGGQYNAGTGANRYLVLWKNGSAITGVPADGTTYLRGDVVGDARVAYVGPGTSFTPRGVIANQDYYFAIYAFNGQGGFENYLTTSPATGNVTTPGENIGTYYNGISTGATSLPTDLNALINPHTSITYFTYKTTMMQEFEVRDTTNGQSYVECVYSGDRVIFDDPFDWTATGFSREHTFAHSWMPTWPADNPEQPEYNDQHNLYPANLQGANTPRSNLPLGDVGGTVLFSYLDGQLGYATGTSGQIVYEPRDQHKGNAARAIFYMAVAYGFDLDGDADSQVQDQDVLKNWHYADLPDNYEIARHEYIYDLQGNRNPFIDSVDFVCFIDFDDLSYLADACGLSVEEKLANNMVVFPLPSNDKVYVQVNGTDITGFTIMDMSGRVVLSNDKVTTGSVELNATDFAPGTYHITVTTPLGSVTDKMIIQ